MSDCDGSVDAGPATHTSPTPSRNHSGHGGVEHQYNLKLAGEPKSCGEFIFRPNARQEDAFLQWAVLHLPLQLCLSHRTGVRKQVSSRQYHHELDFKCNLPKILRKLKKKKLQIVLTSRLSEAVAAGMLSA